MGSMADFMRGGPSKPRYALDVAALEAALGAPLGPLLTELSRLACRLAPFEPWSAFEALGMRLVYLVKDFEREDALGDPENMVVFLETGVELHAAAFVDDGTALPLDQRPVCLLRDGTADVVAPNLAAFLGLAAVAGVEAIHPDREMADFLAEGEQVRRDQEEVAELSKEICRLPGVTLGRATSMKKSRSTKPPALAVDVDDEPREPGLARVRQLVRGGRRKQAKAELVKQIEICLPIADLVPAGRWQEIEALVQELAPVLGSEVRAALVARGLRLE